MRDTSCRPEDLLSASDELKQSLDTRRSALWRAYHEATQSMSRSEYETEEHECWSVLHAGLAGIDAEQRVLEREVALKTLRLGRHDPSQHEMLVKMLLDEYSIEIGGGLGPLAGKIWRVGLMGETSSRENVQLFLSAFCQVLNECGRKTDPTAALAALK